MIRLGSGCTRRWRSPLAIVVAYAVAAQSLLIVLGGFGFAARAADSAPAFELCLHDAQAPAGQPSGSPNHAGCTHCLLCFAGAHHAVLAAAPAVHGIVVAGRRQAWLAGATGAAPLDRYGIANPRGPPLEA